MRAAGQLLHSKLTIEGHKKLQSDEELDALLEKIEALLEKRSGKQPAGAPTAPAPTSVVESARSQ